MNINIVTVTSGWILQKIAERTASNNKDPSIKISVSHTPDYDADVNFYIDIQNCYSGYRTKCDIGYLTHADLDSSEWLTNLMLTQGGYGLDGIVSMNGRYTKMLTSIGYPVRRSATITPGETHGTFPLRKIVLGIVSRGGWPGYGQQFMEKFLSTYDCKCFKFRFLGRGWDALKPISAAHNIDIEFIDDSDYSLYPKFYHTIDHLLIPGMWTAGPMSMQEALSCGVSIIGADVGFVNYEFRADYVFPPGDVDGLSKILSEIQLPILKRRSQVESMTWCGYTKTVVEFIKRIKSYDISRK